LPPRTPAFECRAGRTCTPNLYLGVAPTATTDEIKRRYKERALQYH
jgi:curved DNA-binding protein CbpA